MSAESVPSPSSAAKRPPFSLRLFLRRRLRFIAVVMPAACALLLLPLENYLMELLRHFRLWNAGIGIITGVLLLCLRDWRYAALALLAGGWQGWPLASYRFAPPGPALSAATSGGTAAAPSFTVLSCNLLYECLEPQRMIASLREASPDVLIFVEFTRKWESHFAATLWQDYPHRQLHPRSDAFGICIASRLPLEEVEAVPLVEDVHAVRAVLTVGGQRVVIAGIHPPPPVTPEMYDLWRGGLEAVPGLLTSTAAPASHFIVAGDFNSAPFSRAFTRLCDQAGLRDSAPGFGLRTTWQRAPWLPGLPLDYILVSPRLAVTEHRIGPPAGSDHRWVMARLMPVSVP